MSNTSESLVGALARFQNRWRRGLLLAGLLRAAAWLAVGLIALGILDYYAGFTDPVRRLAAVALLAIAGWGVLRALAQILLFAPRDAAETADRALGSGRRETLSAWELETAPQRTSALAQWLQKRSVASATSRLSSLPTPQMWPAHDVRRAALLLAVPLALLLCTLLVAPRPFAVISQRLLLPGADIPPYTPLQFAISPQPAKVLYGDDIVVTAEITGGELPGPVRFLSRDPGTGAVEETPVYLEGSQRFSRKLEKVASSLEFAFATGRARSAWHRVEALLQPKIQDVLLTVEPPPYSRMPRREFAAGSQPLLALPGSRITARVQSNRPLAGGLLHIETPATSDTPQEIAAERGDTHVVAFSWTLHRPAQLAFTVSDVTGTQSEPMQIEQKALPDERPRVTLREPAGEVLATPDSELPFEATATDDLGLTRVSFVRQLHGYRERSQPQSVQTGIRNHAINGRLDLTPFGVVPGQTIELLVEAGDTNPNLLGVSTSEPARVHIIAPEQYASMLRNQTTLEDFAGRYEALQNAIEEARQSLEALEKAVNEGDAAAVEAVRKTAQEAHAKAGKTFGQIARDFPIFGLDPSLAEASTDVMKQLFENAQDLEKLHGASPADLAEALAALQERLGEGQRRIAEEINDGQRAVAAGRVFEEAAKFRELIDQQREMVKSANRAAEQIRRGETEAGQGLKELAERQQEIAEGLRSLEKDLGKALDELGDEFAPMKEEGRKFLEALKEFDIPPVMEEASRAGDGGDSRVASDRSGEALARMEALLRRKNGFCEMCRGGGEAKFPWPEDISSTLEQLMRALTMRRNPGAGSGENPATGGTGGMGFGDLSDSGFSMPGKMPQLPVYGPPRSRFSQKAPPQLGEGRGRSGRGNSEPRAEVEQRETNVPERSAARGEAVALEAVPEAYREAVKRYFSEDQPNAAAVPAASPSQP